MIVELALMLVYCCWFEFLFNLVFVLIACV